jgi:hypothetical protein
MPCKEPPRRVRRAARAGLRLVNAGRDMSRVTRTMAIDRSDEDMQGPARASRIIMLIRFLFSANIVRRRISLRRRHAISIFKLSCKINPVRAELTALHVC